MAHLDIKSVTRFFVGADDNFGPDLQVKVNMLGPQDEDVSGITPEDQFETDEVFAIQFQDGDDAVVITGEPYRLCVLLEDALDLARAVAREQEEDAGQ